MQGSTFQGKGSVVNAGWSLLGEGGMTNAA